MWVLGSIKLQTLIYACGTLVKSSSRVVGYLRSWRAFFCPKSASSFLTSSVLFLATASSQRQEGIWICGSIPWCRSGSLPRTVLTACLWLHEQEIPFFFGSLCCSSNAGTALQGPGKGSGARQDHGQLWGHLNSVTAALVTHWAVKLTSLWYSQTSHLQCNLETWIALLAQNSCVLIKEHWGKRHPKSKTCSQVSAGTAPELHVGLRKGVGISDSGRDGFTSTLCEPSCQFFMQMVLFSAKN